MKLIIAYCFSGLGKLNSIQPVVKPLLLSHYQIIGNRCAIIVANCKVWKSMLCKIDGKTHFGLWETKNLQTCAGNLVSTGALDLISPSASFPLHAMCYQFQFTSPRSLIINHSRRLHWSIINGQREGKGMSKNENEWSNNYFLSARRCLMWTA